MGSSDSGSSSVDERINVVHVITRLDVGGAQETLIRTCAGLDRSRFRPLIVTGQDTGSGGEMTGRAIEAGVEVVTQRSLRGPIRPFTDAKAISHLTATLRALKPDIVHTHSSKAGALGRVAARRAGVPNTVHTVHGWSFHEGQHIATSWTYRRLEALLAQWTDVLVTVSDTDRRSGLAAGIGKPEQYEVIRSGIALREVAAPTVRAAVRRTLGWSPSDQVVVVVGRLERQKNPTSMLLAFAKARRRVRTLRLAFVGSGTLERQTRRLIDRLGLGASVDLLGLRSDIPDILVAADLLALSSRWEGLPRVVLEAVRADLPVVSYDVGGVSEVITDGWSGRIVPQGRADLLASAIVEIVSLPNKEREVLTRRAASRLDEFSEEVMISSTERLYRHLVEVTVPAPSE